MLRIEDDGWVIPVDDDPAGVRCRQQRELQTKLLAPFTDRRFVARRKSWKQFADRCIRAANAFRMRAQIGCRLVGDELPLFRVQRSAAREAEKLHEVRHIGRSCTRVVRARRTVRRCDRDERRAQSRAQTPRRPPRRTDRLRTARPPLENSHERPQSDSDTDTAVFRLDRTPLHDILHGGSSVNDSDDNTAGGRAHCNSIDWQKRSSGRRIARARRPDAATRLDPAHGR